LSLGHLCDLTVDVSEQVTGAQPIRADAINPEAEALLEPSDPDLEELIEDRVEDREEA